MRRHLLRALFPPLDWLRRFYWRVFRPQTFGVRVVVRQRRTGAFLLVRHSYGRQDLWYPPGGGYRPGREAPEVAARREVAEETGINLGEMAGLGQHQTTITGNRDTILLFLAETEQEKLTDALEIAEARWVHPGDLPGMALSPVARVALDRAEGADVRADPDTG